MIQLESIKNFFPANLQNDASFKKHMLKEYLELQILDFLSTTQYVERIVFIGGKRVNIPSFIVKEGQSIEIKAKESVKRVVKDNIEILNPQGETLKYDFKGNSENPFVFNKIDYMGEYKITGADSSNRFVANLFDEEESRIMPELTDDTELEFEEKEAVTLIKDKKTEFGKYLLLLEPLILLV